MPGELPDQQVNLLVKVLSTGRKRSEWETNVQVLRKFRRARVERSQIDQRALGGGDDLPVPARLERDIITDTCGNNWPCSLSPSLYFVSTHAGNDLQEWGRRGRSSFSDNGP